MNWHRYSIKIKFAVSLGFIVASLLLLGSGHRATALGTKLLDDIGINCDIYDWNASHPACGQKPSEPSRKAILSATENQAASNAFTRARIYYKNIPTTGSVYAPQPASGASYNSFYNQLTFTIKGAAFCPKYSTRPIAGVNDKDNIAATSYYGSHPRQLNNGDKVVDYRIIPSSGSDIPLSSMNNVIGTKREAIEYCLPSGQNYSQTFTVKPQYLKRVTGLKSGVFYIELLVQVDESVQGGDKCSALNPEECSGIGEHFTITENAPSANEAVISSGDVNPLNSQSNAAYRRLTKVPDGFGGFQRVVTSLSANIQDQSISFNSNEDAGTPVSDLKTSHDGHSSYLFSFAPDCTILPYGSAGVDVKLKLYDLDSSNEATDIIKGILLKYDSDGNYAGFLVVQDQVKGYDSSVPADWSSTVPASDTWQVTPNPLLASQRYSKGTELRQQSNSRQVLLFRARPGERYEFYMMNVRHDLLNQIGLPYDSAFASGSAGVTAGSCKATLKANVSVTFNDASQTYSASASVNNAGSVPLVADRLREVYFLDGAGNKVGSTRSAAQDNEQYKLVSPNPKVLGLWNSGNDTGPAPNTSTVPPGAVQVCTKLTLTNPSLSETGDPVTVVSSDSVMMAQQCKPLAKRILPFFTSQGGDVVSVGSVNAWNNNGTPNYLGAYSQIAVLAKSTVQNLPSGYGLIATGLGAGNTGASLLLGNSTADLSDTGNTIYGGSLESVPVHATVNADTTDGLCQPIAAITTPNSLANAPIGTTIYCNDTTNAITLSGSLSAKKRVIVRSKGNVFIKGNVGYTYTSLAELPRLTVVANGADIIVDKDATEVHGVFYAVKLNAEGGGSSGGKFYTCGTDVGGIRGFGTDQVTGIGNAANFAGCRIASLTVYGAVAANQVVLSRSAGGINSTNPVAAETFVYSPEAWLGDNTAATGYNAFTSLAPIF